MRRETDFSTLLRLLLLNGNILLYFLELLFRDILLLNLDEFLPLLLGDEPVIFVVPLIPESEEEVFEQFLQITVVWSFLKFERPRVLHVLNKLVRQPLAQVFQTGLNLFEFYFIVFFLLILDMHSTPWKSSFQEVDE